MKAFIAVMALMSSTATFACANFSGDFTCTVQGDNYTYELTVEQNGTTFKITDDEGTDEFIADGKKRSLPNDTNMRNAYYIASCQGQSVVMKMNGEIVDDQTGQRFPFKADMNHMMKTRNHVTQTTVTELLGQRSTSITQCARN